jgi:uncharacterized membrane protein
MSGAMPGERAKRSLFLILVGLAMAPLAVPWLATAYPLAALVVRGFFSGLCHQNPARSFVIAGVPVAVCTRCLGIYLGLAAGTILELKQATAMRWLAIGLALNGLDVATEMLAWHGNSPDSRFLLGLTLGFGAGAILSAHRVYASAR